MMDQQTAQAVAEKSADGLSWFSSMAPMVVTVFVSVGSSVAGAVRVLTGN